LNKIVKRVNYAEAYPPPPPKKKLQTIFAGGIRKKWCKDDFSLDSYSSSSLIIDVDLSVCLACLVDVGFLENFHDLLRVQVDVQLTEQKFKLV
jgi:hypothetical protein